MAKIDPVKILDPWDMGYAEQERHPPTKIATPVGPKTVHAGEILPDRTVAHADTQIFYISVSVNARPDGWQASPVYVSPGEAVSITAQGQWEVIGENNSGPGGHAGIVAHGPGPGGGFFLADGKAIEGCLLVQDGMGFVQAFPSDSATVYVTAPARVSFIANDELNPVDNHKGYTDNAGFLTVTMNFESLTP